MQNTINQTDLPIEIQDLLQFIDLKENQKKKKERNCIIA